MAAETETPSRVKKLLSSFLSNLSQTTSENKIRLSVAPKTIFTRLEETSVPDARNRKLFYDRVETFSSLTWFAKPLDLSPLVCARYGWENVEYDMLQCVNCMAFLCGQLPKAVDTQIYRDSCKKLKKNLTDSHQKMCKWASSPCPESFLCVPFHDREEILNNFWFRVTSLQSARIPTVTYTSYEEKGISKDTVTGYAEAIRCNGEGGQREASLDAIVCAVCGWLYSESQVNVLQCNLCRRKIGLWNYNNENTIEKKSTPLSDQTISGNLKEIENVDNGGAINKNGSTSTDAEKVLNSGFTNGSKSPKRRENGKSGQNGDTRDNVCSDDDSSEPDRKRPRLEKQSFDPVAEHRYWCPWLQSESLTLNPRQPASRETSPSVSPSKSPNSSGSSVQCSPTQKLSDDQEPAWLLMTKILSHNSEDEFYRQMKQSPRVEGLRHLRKVLQQCTSPTSPPKSS